MLILTTTLTSSVEINFAGHSGCVRNVELRRILMRSSATAEKTARQPISVTHFLSDDPLQLSGNFREEPLETIQSVGYIFAAVV